MSMSTQVEPDRCFDGVNSHAEKEKDPNSQRIIEGDPMKESSEWSEMQIRQNVWEECHHLNENEKSEDDDDRNERIDGSKIIRR